MRNEHINPGLNWIGAGFLILILTKSLAILNGVFVLTLKDSWSSCPGLVHVELQNRLRILSSPYFLGSFCFLGSVGLGKTFCCCHLLCHHLLYHFSSASSRFNYFYFMCVGILPSCMSLHHNCASAHRGQRKGTELSHWVLRIEPTSFSRAMSALNCWTIYPVPSSCFLQCLFRPRTQQSSQRRN